MPRGVPFADQAQVTALADDIAARRSLDANWVRATLAQAEYLPALGRLLLPPANPAAKNWAVYRSRFVEPIRIQAGVRFWRQHVHWLTKAEETYGVPASIIVGIIGVETIYGRQTGNYRVLDVLTTLTLDFPAAHPRAAARQAFFQGELEQFLSTLSRSGASPTAALGSYAGAMGLPQFMPSSWVAHAIDFDGDGLVDLSNSPADAIGSVANYLRNHGWQPGVPTHFPVAFDTKRLDMASLMAPDILPTFSPAEMTERGVLLDVQGQAHPGKLALIELLNGLQAPSYVAGTENFYAITRYNWSSYYAMAVIDLGNAVASALSEGLSAQTATSGLAVNRFAQAPR